MKFLRLPILVIGLIACGMPAQAVMRVGRDSCGILEKHS